MLLFTITRKNILCTKMVIINEKSYQLIWEDLPKSVDERYEFFDKLMLIKQPKTAVIYFNVSHDILMYRPLHTNAPFNIPQEDIDVIANDKTITKYFILIPYA